LFTRFIPENIKLHALIFEERNSKMTQAKPKKEKLYPSIQNPRTVAINGVSRHRHNSSKAMNGGIHANLISRLMKRRDVLHFTEVGRGTDRFRELHGWMAALRS